MNTFQYQIIDPHIHADIQHITECHMAIAVAVGGAVRLYHCYTFADGAVQDCIPDVALQQAVQIAQMSVGYIMRTEVQRGIL